MKIKKIVENLVYDVLHGKNPENLPNYFEGNNYVQHNKDIADGLTGLGEALKALSAAGIEMVYTDTHMVLGQGNFVLVVSEGTFGGEPTSYYDLFRVEQGKVAEHWDVMEPIMDKANWKNDNGKF